MTNPTAKELASALYALAHHRLARWEEAEANINSPLQAGPDASAHRCWLKETGDQYLAWANMLWEGDLQIITLADALRVGL